MPAIDRIVVDRAPWATRVAFLSAGEVVDLWIEAADRPSLLGGIALGRVVALHRDTGSATVAVPGAEVHVTTRTLVEGAAVLVQITRDTISAKRAVARLGVELASGSLVLTSHTAGVGLSAAIGGKARRSAIRSALAASAPNDAGLLVRSTGADIPIEDLVADAEHLAQRWNALSERSALLEPPAWLQPPIPIVTAARSHAPGVEPEIDESGGAFEECGGGDALAGALAHRVPLEGGGELVVDMVEAATLVDVNLPSGGGAEGFRRANEAAGLAAMRQMRLRGVHGTVLLDLPRMTDRATRKRIQERIAEQAATDPVGTRVLGWTPGGMLEIVREGARRPLADDLLTDPREPASSPRAVAWDALRAARREANRIARPRLCVAPAVAAWFDGPGQPILQVERRRLGHLSVRVDPALSGNAFRVESEV